MDPSRIVDHRVINTLSSPEFAELCGNRRAGTSGRQQDIDKTSLWPGEHVRQTGRTAPRRQPEDPMSRRKPKRPPAALDTSGSFTIKIRCGGVDYDPRPHAAIPDGDPPGLPGEPDAGTDHLGVSRGNGHEQRDTRFCELPRDITYRAAGPAQAVLLLAVLLLAAATGRRAAERVPTPSQAHRGPADGSPGPASIRCSLPAPKLPPGCCRARPPSGDSLPHRQGPQRRRACRPRRSSGSPGTRSSSRSRSRAASAFLRRLLQAGGRTMRRQPGRMSTIARGCSPGQVFCTSSGTQQAPGCGSRDTAWPRAHPPLRSCRAPDSGGP